MKQELLYPTEAGTTPCLQNMMERVIFMLLIMGLMLLNYRLTFPLQQPAWSSRGIRAFDCEVDCSELPEGAKVPDPRNCYRYYYCLTDHQPSDRPLTCPENTPIFDPSAGECVASGPCTISCMKGCASPCNGTLDIVRNPLDCSSYYVCLPSGVDEPVSCPLEKPYFDGEFCITDSYVCCTEDDYCNPVCVAEATEIPDPRDCRKFYICTSVGLPLPENHFDCHSGEVFDIYLGRCSMSAECTTLCYDSK